MNATYQEFCNFRKVDGILPHELFILELPENISIHFRYGSEPHTLIDYEEAHIIISISLVAGFNAHFKPGDLVIPTSFVPMDLDAMILKLHQKYLVKNYFLEDLPKIVDAQDTKLLAVINNNFNSPNKDKSALKATKFTSKDFNEVVILHGNKNFSPSLLPKEFTMKMPRKPTRQL